MKKILYWSPFLTKIATIKSVVNSAISLNKYDKTYDVYIINSVGEWNSHKTLLNNHNIKVIDLLSFNLHKYLPKRGYLASRFSLLLISIISFIPLIIFLMRIKPDYFLSHLNTLFTMIISNFFKINFIIRISGYPKLHWFRRICWNFFSKTHTHPHTWVWL